MIKSMNLKSLGLLVFIDVVISLLYEYSYGEDRFYYIFMICMCSISGFALGFRDRKYADVLCGWRAVVSYTAVTLTLLFCSCLIIEIIH